MKSIKLTKKDIKQIAESCVKNILKEDFFQNNMNNQYDNDEEEFETDNEPYYDRQQYHNFILKTLENFTNEMGDGQVFYDKKEDGYWIIPINSGIEIFVRLDVSTGKLIPFHVKASQKDGNINPDDAMNLFKWGYEILNKINSFSVSNI